jgi:hypothetical protein
MRPMGDTDRLERIERRQVETHAVLNEMLGVLETTNESLTNLATTIGQVHGEQAELMAWLQEPPTSDISDLLRRLTASIDDMRSQLQRLPAALERAVMKRDVTP